MFTPFFFVQRKNIFLFHFNKFSFFKLIINGLCCLLLLTVFEVSIFREEFRISCHCAIRGTFRFVSENHKRASRSLTESSAPDEALLAQGFQRIVPAVVFGNHPQAGGPAVHCIKLVVVGERSAHGFCCFTNSNTAFI